MRIGLYAGTFDPVTNGHIDILSRSLAIFDKVIVAVAASTPKTTMFSLDERLEMFRAAIPALERAEVEPFDGLLVAFARERGAVAMIRGLRVVSDFEYEFQMALMNRHLDRGLETVFLMPSAEYTYLNSTLIKAVASTGGDISQFVPEIVARKLSERFKQA
ncbi:MAG: pantetheine-phosphate adenylyltransferase [Candidatus Eisenbacteria bacterium]